MTGRREVLLTVGYWAALIASLVALVVVVLQLHAVVPPADPDVLHVVGGEAEDRSSASGWTSAALPDDWLARDFDGDELWYRFILPLDRRPGALWGIYIPTAHLNAAVYVNGQLVGDGGRFESPVARVWPKPLYFAIGPEQLRSGDNELNIYLKTEPAGTGLLTDFYVGPDALLQPTYRFRNALKAIVPTVFVALLVILAALLASITLRRRDETEYAWFAAILLALACFALPALVTDIPVATRVWDWFRIVSVGWAVVFITIFVHRYLSLSRPRVERAAIALMVVGSVAIALVPGYVYYRWAARLWVVLCIGWGLYPCMELVRSVLAERRFENFLLLLSGLGLLVFGGRDALMQARLISRDDGFLIHYNAILLALVFTWILLSQLVDARREAETLNLELEQRVRDKTAEIDGNYRQLRVLERERTLTGERERIMRDMHDGLGGHLIGAIALLERSGAGGREVGAILRHASDDLRLVIQSFEPCGDDLGMLLGGLRARLQRQVEAAGFELNWSVEDTRPLENLGPRIALHVLRIVQEAVNNALRHSGGGRVTVRCRDADDGTGGVWLDVDDDGGGLRADAPPGRGLANMRSRAREANAQLEIVELEIGTRVRLHIA